MRFEQVPAERAGSRSADALAGAEGGAVSDRGGAGQLRRRRLRAADGQEFVVIAGAPRRRSRSTRRCAPRPARTPASSTSRRSTSSTRCSPDAGARPATGCWSTSPPTTRRSRSCAAPHLIFFRSRARRGRGHARRPGAPDGDVLRGSAERRRLRPRAAVRRRGGRRAAGGRRRADCAAASRSGWRRRSRPSIRATAATLTDRIAGGAGAARHAGAARRPAAARIGRRPRDPHQPLDPAVLQRARRPPLAAVLGAGRGRRGDALQRRRGSCATRSSDTELATQASRDEARAAELRAAGGRGCARSVDPQADRSRRRPTRGRPTS